MHVLYIGGPKNPGHQTAPERPPFLIQAVAHRKAPQLGDAVGGLDLDLSLWGLLRCSHYSPKTLDIVSVCTVQLSHSAPTMLGLKAATRQDPRTIGSW